jgi:hypothetical protein
VDQPWWKTVQRDGEGVPAWVQANLRFYDRATKRARSGFYTLEVLAVVVSAAIPAVTAAGASAAVAGVLGACVAALIGLRQVAGWRESWVRFAQTRFRLEREVIAWSSFTGEYAGDGATKKLLLATAALVATETDRWAAFRLTETESHRVSEDSPGDAGTPPGGTG